MNVYTIKITKEAKNDLKMIKNYFQYNFDELEIGRNMIKKLKECIKTLSNFPERFPLLNDKYLSMCHLRKYIVNHYMILYYVDKNTKIVHIIRIIYAKRNWMKLL